ncbi:MAG TPA: hypothetical protein VHO46_11610 [Bacteroidales bacterium]|nr:hypothetical protein [Bacteroidales bacterium]
MNRKLITYASLLIIVVFIGYIVYDSIKPSAPATEKTTSSYEERDIEDAWKIDAVIHVNQDKLTSVAASPDGSFYAAGNSFVSCYSDTSKIRWTYKSENPVTAIAVHSDTVYAATVNQILVINDGKLLNEWGPYENNSIITSVSAGSDRIALCDAGNRRVYIIDKGGEVLSIVGQKEPQFVLPSAYFDVAISTDNTFWVANTGYRRIERRSNDGNVEGYFGEAGLAPEAFCGCCNPAHFTLIPGGFITAEKGINRIKILDDQGKFVEYVSSHNDFTPSVPLDIASADGQTIYAANPADSKIYIFKRKQETESIK